MAPPYALTLLPLPPSSEWLKQITLFLTRLELLIVLHTKRWRLALCVEPGSLKQHFKRKRYIIHIRMNVTTYMCWKEFKCTQQTFAYVCYLTDYTFFFFEFTTQRRMSCGKMRSRSARQLIKMFKNQFQRRKCSTASARFEKGRTKKEAITGIGTRTGWKEITLEYIWNGGWCACAALRTLFSFPDHVCRYFQFPFQSTLVLPFKLARFFLLACHLSLPIGGGRA